MRVFLLVIALLALAVLTWYLRSAPAGDDVHFGSAAAPREDSRSSGETSERGRTSTSAVERPAREDTERRRIAARTRQPGEIEVHCLHAADGRPLPGAKVGYRRHGTRPELADLPATEQRGLREHDLDVYERLGEVLVCDSRGRCWLQRKTGLLVFARHGNLFASAWLKLDDDGPLRLRLQVDRRLELLVRDAAGQPAPRVMMFMQDQEPSARRVGMGRADAEGRFVIPHLQASMYAREYKRGFKVTAQGYGLESDPFAVDPFGAPLQRAELQLPPGGSITFHLQDASGAPYPFLADLGSLRLRFAVHDSEPGPRDSQRGLDGVFGAFDAGGRLRVDHVALDRFYSAQQGDLFRSPQIGRGPTRSAPHIDVPLRVSDTLVLLRGRAVDAKGETLAGRRLTLDLRHAHGWARPSLETDAKGYFIHALPHVPADGRIQIIGQIGPRFRPEFRYERKQATPLRAGMNELGDCPFLPMPLLLGGELVLAEGLQLQSQPRLQIQELRGNNWHTRPDLYAQWSASGQFQFRGAAPPDTSLRLLVPKGAWRARDPIPFRAGTQDLRLILTEAGRLEVKILIGELEIGARLRPRLDRQQVSPAPQPENRRRGATEDGLQLRSSGEGTLRATWQGLEPGAYRLRVFIRGMQAAVLDIPDIQIRPGDNTDPRLQDIDLRTRAQLIDLRVLDENGGPLLQDGAQVLLADDGQQHWHALPLQKGRVQVATFGPTRLRVLAPGYRLAVVEDARKTPEIRLQPGPQIRVRVQWPSALPQGLRPAVRLHPRLAGDLRGVRYSTDSGRSAALSTRLRCGARLHNSGEASLRPAVPGQYHVYFTLDERGESGRYFGATEPRLLQVRMSEDQDLRISISAEVLRKALSALK